MQLRLRTTRSCQRCVPAHGALADGWSEPVFRLDDVEPSAVDDGESPVDEDERPIDTVTAADTAVSGSTVDLADVPADATGPEMTPASPSEEEPDSSAPPSVRQ